MTQSTTEVKLHPLIYKIVKISIWIELIYTELQQGSDTSTHCTRKPSVAQFCSKAYSHRKICTEKLITSTKNLF